MTCATPCCVGRACYQAVDCAMINSCCSVFFMHCACMIAPLFPDKVRPLCRVEMSFLSVPVNRRQPPGLA